MDKIIDVKKRKRGGNDERTSWKIIDFVRENRTVPGCTISKQIYHENGTGISIFAWRKYSNTYSTVGWS